MSEQDLITLTAAGRAIVDRIDERGRAYVVGGAVRDALIARYHGVSATPKDLDIEAHGYVDYEDLAWQLEGIGRLDFRGKAFGILAITVDGEDFEVSLPDGGEGERGASARRDLTINAMGWRSSSGELVDYFGGVDDLKAKVLRPTSESFADDPLRVVRAAQFVARFGFTPSPELIQVSNSLSNKYNEISVERVWGEWRKIGRRGVAISSAVRALETFGWLKHFPALHDLAGVPQDPMWHPEGDVLTHVLLAADAAARRAELDGLDPVARELAVLASLLHDVGKASTTIEVHGRIFSQTHDVVGAPLARRFLLDIGASGDFATRVGILVREHMTHLSVQGPPSAAAVRRLVRRLDRDGTGVTIEDWARVVDADLAGRGPGSTESSTEIWLERARAFGARPAPGLLTGRDLISAGWLPGPEFKKALGRALDAQDDGEFLDHAGALRWFERNYPVASN